MRLTASAAVALAMVLHELASNAAKHGALSGPGGRVRVAWALRSAVLDVAWTEEGGPPVEGRPVRRGFGSILLDRVPVRQFGGELALDFAATGLRCRMLLPVSERLLAA
jgi:two-component sensor histidine kinase